MTIYLSDLFSLDDFRAQIDAGYVNVQSHPTLPLSIANYSHKCQYDHAWNDVTRQCRGLIFDTQTHRIVARPFPKFFNLGELDDSAIPSCPFRVLEKLDGSLGILYPDNYPQTDSYAIATRGSFISDQAIHATAILKSRYMSTFTPNPNLTYLFEIVYPANRIVVDYGSRDTIILLEVLDTDTHTLQFLSDSLWTGEKVRDYTLSLPTLRHVLAAPQESNAEGYVLRFDNGMRVKVKHDEYVRLHRILTGTTARTVWEYVSTGQSIGELVSHVPDEFYAWIENKVNALTTAYRAIEDECRVEYERAVVEENRDTDNPRRGFARAVAGFRYRAVLFLMLDGHDYSSYIWKTLYPAHEIPFRDDEAS